MPRLTGLIERAQNLATLLPSFARFDDMERQCLAAAEPPEGLPQPITFAREIRLDGLSFDYRNYAPKAAVRDVSLVFPSGTTTAIVGPSGAGKTTLADLLLGLVEAGAGRILIDGHPLERCHYAAWRDQIGYVSQDTFLFHDSVRANLLWARPDASEADLLQALHLAAADSFVAELPHGLDTVVGDRGVLVSGGERQRLALARALLRRPKLLILDEATNALDSENERRIQDAIDSLRQQMTIVVITHRLSMVRGADRIHVMDQGRIVESGSWAELAARAGSRFSSLSQTRRTERIDERQLDVVGR
jgi:ATP-binding cassette subfamily C protein